MTQVWHNLVDTLRLLPSVPSPADVVQPASERKTLDDAVEKIGLLISMRKGQGTQPELLAPLSSVPMVPSSSATSLAGGIKRKRRLSVSVSASPAPAIPPSSAHLAVDSPLPRSATPSAYPRDTNKLLKDMYADQLPLQPGRKVAFKVPAAKNARGVEEEGGEDWILAMIKRCLESNRLKYEVQDADDAQKCAFPPPCHVLTRHRMYNTTLRSIIPLPDPDAASHLSSHPSNLEEYPKGFQVLALYPDTTSFYRATVLSTGKGTKERYRLAFVDDGDKVHEVSREFVVPVSH